MIKRATVTGQIPSAAKKNMYLTFLNDGCGELRAYSTRLLEVGTQIVVSVQQGAARDPLSVDILPKKQADAWLAQNPETLIPEQPESVEPLDVSIEAIQELVENALKNVADGSDEVDPDTRMYHFISGAFTVKTIAKKIYEAARNAGYAIEGATSPTIYDPNKEYPKIELKIWVDNDNGESDPALFIGYYEVL